MTRSAEPGAGGCDETASASAEPGDLELVHAAGRQVRCPEARAGRPEPIRRFIRIGALLAIIGLMDLTRGAHPPRHLLLGGAVLTVAGIAVAAVRPA